MELSNSKEITFSDVVLSFIAWIKYLLSKWLYILLFIVIGALIGWLIAYLSPRKYTATSNFVLESSSAAPMGLPFGLGLGNDPSAGLFNTMNNIIWLYTSNTMLERALLTAVPYENGEKVLINEFIRTSKVIEKYIDDNPKYKNIQFRADQSDFSIQESAFLGVCTRAIRKEYLKVSSVENTENIISVELQTEDELFAFNFTQVLVRIVNEFYINTKSKKSIEHLTLLEHKADSLRQKMDNSMVTTATKIDNIPYPNPNLSVLKVEPQKSSVDVQANTGLYLQVIQSLESARNEMNKEKPIIQIVDMPRLPLNSSALNKKIAIPVGAIIGLFFVTIFIVIRKIIRDILKNKKQQIII